MVKYSKIDIINLIIGILGIVLLIIHVTRYTEVTWMVLSPNEYYYGNNIVAWYCDFTFFTYWCLLLSCTWLCLLGINSFVSSKRLESIVNNKYLILFIGIYQLVVITMYSIFELTAETITFGLYDNSFNGFYCLFENIIVHYVITIFTIIITFKKAFKCAYDKKKGLFVLIFPAIYYIISFIICNYVIDLLWSPYPIFSSEALFNYLNIDVSLTTFTSYLIIIGVVVVIMSLLVILTLGIIKIINKRVKK